jgi:hypothetical protein
VGALTYSGLTFSLSSALSKKRRRKTWHSYLNILSGNRFEMLVPLMVSSCVADIAHRVLKILNGGQRAGTWIVVNEAESIVVYRRKEITGQLLLLPFAYYCLSLFCISSLQPSSAGRTYRFAECSQGYNVIMTKYIHSPALLPTLRLMPYLDYLHMIGVTRDCSAC